MFYTFRQNNSYGVMDYNAEVGICEFVSVEADTESEAIARFTKILQDERYKESPSCLECCGERWVFYPHESETPCAWRAPGAYERTDLKGGYISFIHYADGTIAGTL